MDRVNRYSDNPLFPLLSTNRFFGVNLSPRLKATLKIEGLNPSGSIKMKTALSLISGLEHAGFAPPQRIVESSSGNLGIALSMVCANRGYHFTCVVDLNTPKDSQRIMRALGTEVIEVREKDQNGGYLQNRIDRIKKLLDTDSRYVWTNQYANPDNTRVHFETTAEEIYAAYPNLQYLFVGSGTTGTLTGISRYFREKSPRTHIIAVEPMGSITFGGKPGPRKIPGLGTSRVPELANPDSYDELLYIDDKKSILMCRNIAKKTGLLLGGSSGTVLAGVQEYFGSDAGQDIVAISPDLGDRYLNTIYNDDWVQHEFPGLIEPNFQWRPDECASATNAPINNALAVQESQ